MDLTILLKEYNEHKSIRDFYSSFEEYADVQMGKAKKNPPVGYDENGFRVLGREGLFHDWDKETLDRLTEAASHLKNNDYDKDIYDRMIADKKLKEQATIQAMKSKLKGMKNGTI